MIHDEKKILIESGYPRDADDLLLGLERLSVRPEEIDYVAVTHIHADHAGGVGHLAEANPSLKIFVHQKGARHLVDPSRLNESVRGAHKEDFAQIGEMLPVPSQEMIVCVGTGDRIELGETCLEVYATPGHAKHHVVYFDRAFESIFSGDALGSKYDGHPNFILAPPTDYDPELSKASIDLIQNLGPKRIHFTHCGPYDMGQEDDLFNNLKAQHDLWCESLLEIVKDHPRLHDEALFEAFLDRFPELKRYSSKFFSFKLSVNGILLYLERSGRL